MLGAAVLVLAMTTVSREDRRAVPSVGVGVEGVTSVLSRDVRGESVPIRLEEVSRRSGVSFRHFPAQRESLLPEDMGSGVACGDYDGDGFVDLYFVNLSGSVMPGSPFDRNEGGARLFRNVEGAGFEDVTDRAGVGFVGYGMGAAWGDYDNDADLDLYVTAFGRNVLYQNAGDGTFRDVTEQSRTQDVRFSTGCSWGDYNRDGHIDLYVSNYVDFAFREEDRGGVKRQYSTEQPYTLNPSSYGPQPNSLFHNRGDGTFEEVAAAAGVADPTGRSLSASWVDFDNDGWIDLYVANDVSNNGVFLNRRDGTFEDIGAGSLAADYRGAMGIAVADFDDDLDQDLFITHWIAQENALYRNMMLDAQVGASPDRRVWFMDEAENYGLGQVSLDMVGWATGFVDLDNDGRRDLWVVNGSTLEQSADHRRLQPQRPLLFWNRGRDGYIDVAEAALGEAARPNVARGGAQLDWNRDGLVDLIWVIHSGEPLLLRNVSAPTGHWLGVTLRQKGANTQALGGRVVLTAGGRTWMEEVGAGSSYLSQHEPTLHFGLGEVSAVDSLRILWPDGREDFHEAPGVDRSLAFTHAPEYASVTRLGGFSRAPLAEVGEPSPAAP